MSLTQMPKNLDEDSTLNVLFTIALCLVSLFTVLQSVCKRPPLGYGSALYQFHIATRNSKTCKAVGSLGPEIGNLSVPRHSAGCPLYEKQMLSTDRYLLVAFCKYIHH